MDAPDQAALRQPIDKLDSGVMTNPKPLRKIADRNRTATRKSLDRQQRLMLARRQADALRRFLAEFEKATDQMTEFRQRLIIGKRRRLRNWPRLLAHIFSQRHEPLRLAMLYRAAI